MKKFITAAALIAAAPIIPTSAAIVSAAGNGAGGVTGPAFYVDGELYRTVGTPTDFTHTGAPEHSFDTIYGIADQPNVATAAPGDRDFNGGRWLVRPVEFSDDDAYDAAVQMFDTNGSDDLDSAEEVEAAVEAGLATILDPVRSFECPVIHVPGH